MGQVTLYLESELEKRMKAAAKAEGLSQSRWVARLIEEKVSDEWPESIRRLAGTWKDDFPSAEELRCDLPTDIPRESL